MRITARAQAKINWSLDVCAGRNDGYHELDMLMQRIDLSDVLTFERARWLSLTVNGRPLPVGGRNLVLQAAQALNQYMGKRLGARITLQKNIPIRAGLGGGSADCAATLIALNRLWELRLPVDALLSIGRTLGADVPYCIAGGFARVGGMGERIRALGAGEKYPLVLVHVGRGLSTAQVFAEYDRMGATLGLDNEALARAILARNFDRIDALCANALEAPSMRLLPQIGEALQALRALGARTARMSGSGSAVFGVFRTCAEAMRAAEQLPGALLTWTC